MKRLLSALCCLLCLAFAANVRAETPNMRQSINYFMNYFNEAVVQGIHIKEYQEKEKIDQKRPYSEEYVFFADLNARIEKTLGLSLNLCDIYFIYNKTTYCFTKDEKSYLFDRIDNIVDTLGKIRDTKYNVSPALLEDKKSTVYANLVEFNERVDKLREFVKSSLGVFNR
jgi:hypothetical protein